MALTGYPVDYNGHTAVGQPAHKHKVEYQGDSFILVLTVVISCITAIAFIVHRDPNYGDDLHQAIAVAIRTWLYIS